jgi:hypothetical protein
MADDPKKLAARLGKIAAEGLSDPVHLSEDATTGDRFLIYSSGNGITVELRFESDRLWMTQAQIGQLFGRDVSTISRHIANVLEEEELDESTSLQKVQTTSGRPATLYSLDMVISVGYRVSSAQATLFRRWATDKLVQFATKGFVVDVERLKEPQARDHFRELREIIREIRASEANVYRELREIIALCSDYAAMDEHRKNVFFASVQNKLLYAVTGMTAQEIRVSRAVGTRENMGLTTWKGRQPNKRDIETAKNFLADAEMKDLNRFTNMLLDYFEQETDLQRLVLTADAEKALEKFIRNNERPLLRGAGSVTRAQADEHCDTQFEIFNDMRKRRYLLDPEEDL